MTLQIQEPTIRATANQEQQQIKNNSKSRTTAKANPRTTATDPLLPTAGRNGAPAKANQEQPRLPHSSQRKA
jgi:hypothetical protein